MDTLRGLLSAIVAPWRQPEPEIHIDHADDFGQDELLDHIKAALRVNEHKIVAPSAYSVKPDGATTAYTFIFHGEDDGRAAARVAITHSRSLGWRESGGVLHTDIPVSKHRINVDRDGCMMQFRCNIESIVCLLEVRRRF